MNWIESINRVLNHIEDNLEKDLSSETLASVACSSQYHFMRAFSMLTGKGLGEYIKERRLTVAGKTLVTTSEKIVDIALKLGYETPESFSKAFKRFHGITPGKARNTAHILKVPPPLHIRVILEGDQPMEYKITEKEAFKIMGISTETSYSEAPVNLPLFNKELKDKGIMDELYKNAGPLGVLGISYNHRPKEGLYRFLLGIEADKGKGSYEDEIEIPSSCWSVFRGEGEFPGAITEAWKRIFEEWFPATGYKHAGLPEIEFSYPSEEAGRVIWEIWIPIVR